MILLTYAGPYSAEIDKIQKFCKQKKIPLIEDNYSVYLVQLLIKTTWNIVRYWYRFDFGKQLPLEKGGCLLTKVNREFLFSWLFKCIHGHKLLKGIPRGIDTADMPGLIIE